LQRDPNDGFGHGWVSPGTRPGQIPGRTGPPRQPPRPRPATVSGGGGGGGDSLGHTNAAPTSATPSVPATQPLQVSPSAAGETATTFQTVLQSLVLLIGLASYTAVYFAYNYVYAEIGVNPSELGLNYISLLGRSPGAVICITFVILPIVILFTPRFRLLVVLVVVGTLSTYSLASFYAQEHQRVEDKRTTAANWVNRVGQNSTAQVTQFIQNIGETRRSLVDGDKIQPSGLFGVTVLDISAVPSKLIWLDDPGNSSSIQESLKLGPGCVTYLGESDGLSVVYNPQNKVITRLPVGKVLVVRVLSETRLAASITAGQRRDGSSF